MSAAIVLAVCSKNESGDRPSGFQHPDSILKLEHFAAFRANWEPKHENIKAIAEELNLGLDSFVFVDDNPAERAIVAAQLPVVAVPDVGSDVASSPRSCKPAATSRPSPFRRRISSAPKATPPTPARAVMASKFADYGEYLDSLQMTAEIDSFPPVYLDRITQLINKTNQFNLTTRRYTFGGDRGDCRRTATTSRSTAG